MHAFIDKKEPEHKASKMKPVCEMAEKASKRFNFF